ncbi:hypothetical protein J6590_100944 [Homalodisca vitripennis]|nr:hypothetical protein J6590_100944 [Homalodisca vitripennis]
MSGSCQKNRKSWAMSEEWETTQALGRLGKRPQGRQKIVWEDQILPRTCDEYRYLDAKAILPHLEKTYYIGKVFQHLGECLLCKRDNSTPTSQ